MATSEWIRAQDTKLRIKSILTKLDVGDYCGDLFDDELRQEVTRQLILDWVKNFYGSKNRYYFIKNWLSDQLRKGKSSMKVTIELLRPSEPFPSEKLEQCESHTFVIIDNWINEGGMFGGQEWKYALSRADAKQRYAPHGRYRRPKGFSGTVTPQHVHGEPIEADHTAHTFNRRWLPLPFSMDGKEITLANLHSFEDAARRVFFKHKRYLIDQASLDDPNVIADSARPVYRYSTKEDWDRASDTCSKCGSDLLQGDKQLDYATSLHEEAIQVKKADEARGSWERHVTPRRLAALYRKARREIANAAKGAKGLRADVLFVTLDFLDSLVSERAMRSNEGIDIGKWWLMAGPGVVSAGRSYPAHLNILERNLAYGRWLDELELKLHGLGEAEYQSYTRLTHSGVFDYFFVFIGHTPMPRRITPNTQTTRHRLDDLYWKWLRFGPASSGGGSGGEVGEDGPILCRKCREMMDRFSQGKVNPKEAMEFREHVSSCYDCFYAFEALIADEQRWGRQVSPKRARLRERYQALIYALSFKGQQSRLVLVPSLLGAAAAVALILLLVGRWKVNQAAAQHLSATRDELRDLREKLRAAEAEQNMLVQTNAKLAKAQEQLRAERARRLDAETRVAKLSRIASQDVPLKHELAVAKANVAAAEKGVRELESAKRLAVRENSLKPISPGLYRKANGDIIVAVPLNASDEKAVALAIQSGQVEIPAEVRRWNLGEQNLGAEAQNSASVILDGPVNTAVSGTPIFKWRARAGATAYRLTIQTTGRDPVATILLTREGSGGWVVKEYGPDLTSPIANLQAASGSEWDARDSNLRPLDRGVPYRWLVDELTGDAVGDAPIAQSPIVHFSLLSKEEEEEVDRLRATYGPSHLLLGIVFAEKGLLPEARQELAKSPKGIASRILASLPKGL